MILVEEGEEEEDLEIWTYRLDDQVRFHLENKSLISWKSLTYIVLTSNLLFPTALYDDLTVPITTNLYISCISPKVKANTDFDWLGAGQMYISHCWFLLFSRWTRRSSAKSLVSMAHWPVWRLCGPERMKSAAGPPTEPLWLSWQGKMQREPWLHLMVQLTPKIGLIYRLQ